MKILLIGSSGQLGLELTDQLSLQNQLIALSSTELDITDHLAVEQMIAHLQPDIIVNAAAYTAVDKAESEKKDAYVINADAVANLARLANMANAWLIHYSTDYVFDGEKSTPYSEDDETSPINIYGASKLAGENHIQMHMDNYLIFRTTWIIGNNGNNFAKTILHHATHNSHLSVINDQLGVPTTPALITKVTIDAINAIKNNHSWPVGIYNLVPTGTTTWYEIAKLLIFTAEQNNLFLKTSSNKIQAITTAAYPTPAKRPLNSQLSTKKLDKHLSFKLPHWRNEFIDVARVLIEQQKRI